MKIVTRICACLLLLVMVNTVFAAPKGELAIGTVKSGATVSLDRIINDGKVLVSVNDLEKQPLLGLGVEDFTVNKGNKIGRVVSVQSVAESQDVPLNIVMVLDNSYSMYERNAIKALLAGIDNMLKVVRPTDQVHMVVFDNKFTSKVGERNLHVKTFTSSNVDELREFAKKSYSQQGLTATTVLYEGMLAGLDVISKQPATNPRIMVIFSDGEDLNSDVENSDVINGAKSVGKFNAYAIDYMPGPYANKFLTSFASQNHGQIWKATSEESLASIFESVAKTMDYSYILTYVFTQQPVAKLFDVAALFDIDKADLKSAGKEQIKVYKEESKSEFRRANKIKISGHTDNTGSAEHNLKLSRRRAEAVRDYLVKIEVDPAKIVVVGEGMSRPVADNRTKEGRAKNRRVEIELQ